ncbi:protein FAM204A isoform 4-T6 [Porphyrio hochstetteri]
MWSGLLPPGLNESDVDLSSDEEDEPHSSVSKEDTERVQLSESQANGPESNAISEPVLLSVADEESKSQTCPSGISINMWNKFLELQKKNQEMKSQANQENKSRKRKRRRKEKQKKNDEVTKSQQLANEDRWKELTQYFGINDRFESPVGSKAPQKLGVKIAKAAACRNFVKAKQEAEAAQEAQKKKKLAWGFEAKKRWETKSNMGYM